MHGSKKEMTEATIEIRAIYNYKKTAFKNSSYFDI